MLTSQQWGTIDEYLKLGISITKIAQLVDVSKPTIYKRKSILKQSQNSKNDRVNKKESELFKYKLLIKRALKLRITNKKVIYDIVKEKGYKRSYDTFLRGMKKLEHHKKKQYKPSTKRRTAPGEEAQMDWGYYGKILMDDKARKVWFFVYVLGYSRSMYVEFTVNQNRKTLKQCHINTFKKLGVPRKIAYDNMKTVFKEEVRLENGKTYRKPSPEFLDFAHCFGFEVFLCHPHHPRSKGKVENVVKFVKQNFLQGFRFKYRKSEITLGLLNQEVQKWITEYHERIHDETHEKPNVLWQEEKHYLHFPDASKLITIFCPMLRRKVSKDGYIVYRNFGPFQLSSEYIEEYVDVKETNENGISYIEVYFKDKKVAKFLLSNGDGHINLLDQENGMLQKVANKNNGKKTNFSPIKGKSIISHDGYYLPDGYYNKFSKYK